VEALLDAVHKKSAVGPEIHLAAPSCTTTRDVVVGHAACRLLYAILAAIGGNLCEILQAKFAELPFYEVG
jgi:hypothetical protein